MSEVRHGFSLLQRNVDELVKSEMNSESVSCCIEVFPGFNAVTNDSELRNVNASITPEGMTSRFEDQSQQKS